MNKNLEIEIFKNKKMVISRDSKQWIIDDKERDEQKYFTRPESLLMYLIDKEFENLIVQKGLIDALNNMKIMKQKVKKEMSIIMDAIQSHLGGK